MSTVRANSILDSSGGNTAQINGMTPTAQSLQGFRNRFINGSMAVWQRGTSGFANGAYGADRWLGLNITTVAQSSDTPSAAFPFSIDFANTAASFPLVMQRIESVNSADLVGQQVTLSFWAKNVSGSSNLFCELFYPNAKDNFASSTFIQSFVASASPSSSWTFYSGTFNALPSQVANGLEVRIVRNNASASQTRITGVQLEAGSVATPFERRDYGRELMMCQRYYETGSVWGVSYASSGAAIQRCQCPFQTVKRANPTNTVSVVSGSLTAPAFVDSRTNMGWIGFSAASSSLEGLFSYTSSAEL